MIEFREINKQDVDYNLLQLADPNLELVKAYLENSIIIELLDADTRIGCLVLTKISGGKIEFKNIAIYEPFHNKGYGYKLLMHGLERCKALNYTTAIIGTCNSGFGQLYLYQKVGFEVDHIIHNFFVDNYKEKITENGIECKHMIVLSKEI